MLLQRALISFTLGPLLLYMVYLGGWFFFIPLTVLITIGTFEYSNIMREMGLWVPTAVLTPLVLLQLVAANWINELPEGSSFFALSLAIFTAMCVSLWSFEKQKSESVSADWMALTTGIVIFGWIGGHFFRLRGLDPILGSDAWHWTLLAFLATFFADTFAYLVGVFLAGRFGLGRHQLTPRLSPKKSWEGYIGALLLTVFGIWLVGRFAFGIAHIHLILLALTVSLLSTAGDLSMSLLKRESGVKDSGKLFPGHGGALDRIDSLIWGPTFVYYFLFIAALF